MSETIALRCYTGEGVGLGHLMRCRELARVMKARGHRTIVMGPPEAMREPGDEELFDIWHAGATDFDAEKDAEAFVALCMQHGARYAIMDDYRIDPDYQLTLRSSGIRWLQQFDASRPWDFWADVLVNAGPHERMDDYAPFLRNLDARKLFGPRFAVLRTEFTAIVPQPDGRPVRKLFLSFGGGGDAGLIGRCVDALRPLLGNDFGIVIASGRHNRDNAAYDNRFADEPFVDFRIAPANMASLMRDSDLGLLAGGTMSYEAAICGLPLILVSVADNQERACMGWQERIGAKYLGRADVLSSEMVRETVMALAADSNMRAKMASLGRKAVDGRGATRLIDALLDE